MSKPAGINEEIVHLRSFPSIVRIQILLARQEEMGRSTRNSCVPSIRGVSPRRFVILSETPTTTRAQQRRIDRMAA
jgi:hypothetical protein